MSVCLHTYITAMIVCIYNLMYAWPYPLNYTVISIVNTNTLVLTSIVRGGALTTTAVYCTTFANNNCAISPNQTKLAITQLFINPTTILSKILLCEEL